MFGFKRALECLGTETSRSWRGLSMTLDLTISTCLMSLPIYGQSRYLTRPYDPRNFFSLFRVRQSILGESWLEGLYSISIFLDTSSITVSLNLVCRTWIGSLSIWLFMFFERHRANKTMVFVLFVLFGWRSYWDYCAGYGHTMQIEIHLARTPYVSTFRRSLPSCTGTMWRSTGHDHLNVGFAHIHFPLPFVLFFRRLHSREICDYPSLGFTWSRRWILRTLIMGET